MSGNFLFNLREVMIYSVAAYKQNGEDYINYGNCSNKRIMQSHMGVVKEFDMCFVDHVTEDCATVADEIIKYYRGLTFKGLGGKINDFEQKVLGMIQSGQVKGIDFGIVASLPKAYYRSIKRDTTSQQMRALSADSQHIGNEGDDVKGVINIFNCSYIQRLGCYIVNAEMNGNIICFFTKHGQDHWGDTCTIAGRVKRHQTSRMNNGKETVLNYVKVIDG